MKKQFFVGLLAGLLLATAFPVFGAVGSLVGKEVQAENYVIVNGSVLDVKAVNIDGTTYSPNRAIADALEMDIKFENQKIYFDSKKPNDSSDINTTVTGGDDVPDNEIQKQIGQLEMKITEEVDKMSELMRKDPLQPATEEDKKLADEINAKIKEYQKQIDELKAQLDT